MFNLEKLSNTLTVLLKENCGSVKSGLVESGVDKNLIDNMKRRRSVPSVEAISKIADYFGVSVDYLLGRERLDAALPKDLQELVSLYSSCSPEDRECILRVARNAARPRAEYEDISALIDARIAEADSQDSYNIARRSK